MGNEETFLMKPKVDFCFKELMEDAEIRKGFISALLGVEPRGIERTELLPTHLRKEQSEDKLEIHILELPKLKEREYPETELLNWARFFNAEKKEEFEMAADTSQYIERAYERLTALSADEEKRLEYEAREKAIRDHNYLMTTNLELGRKKGFEQGKNEGLKEGLKEGREEGLKEGRKEGLEEGLKEGREEGLAKGLAIGLEQGVKAFIELCQEDSFSREETAARLIRKFSLSPKSAEEYLKKYWIQET